MPVARHKNAWAEEATSPSVTQAAQMSEPNTREPTAVRLSAQAGSGAAKVQTASRGNTRTSVDDDVLVVASKVKTYIKERSGMNTSAGVMQSLSKHIRRLCDAAIEEAKRKERKTVMDRDVP